jgi:hypothetical protein
LSVELPAILKVKDKAIEKDYNPLSNSSFDSIVIPNKNE